MVLCFLVSGLAWFPQIEKAQAVCPVCTVVVAGGLGLSEKLGVDDFISALWIGGLTLSITAWCWNYLKKRGKLNSLSGIATFLIVYASTFFSLWEFKYLNVPLNTLWGIDKIVFGIAVGTFLFWAGSLIHATLKKKNGGKVYFPFQKVVFPFSMLIIGSLLYYFSCKCF